MSQRCCYQPRCYNNCCDQSSADKCCTVNRNRSCCDCFPTRCTPDFNCEQVKKLKPQPSTVNNAASSNSNSVKPATKVNLKSRNAHSKGAKAKSDVECEVSVPKKIDKYARDQMLAMKAKAAKQSETKHSKNKQNFQYQDMLGKKRMEVINEEQEDAAACGCQCEDDDDDICGYFDSEQSKKLQESCADFLGIVHDTVLDTVQKSIESILRDYFMHTMEKIECLSSQMMRNECLLSKMHYEILDKVALQGEKSFREFKCLSQSLAEYRHSLNNSNNKSTEPDGEKTLCPCTCACCLLKQDEEMLSSVKSRFKAKCNCNFKSGRDSDTETTKTLCSNTDTSLKSYATSKGTSKAKYPDSSSTSITDEVNRSTRLSQDYGDYLIQEQRKQQTDVAGACCRSDCCRSLEFSRLIGVQRAANTFSDNSMDRRLPSCSCDSKQTSPTKYISVKSGPSGTDLLSSPSS